MLIRFVSERRDPDSGRREGIFHAQEELLKTKTVSLADRAELEALHVWFCKNLPMPDRLAVSRRPHAKAQAISWFKDTAIEHIGRMRTCQAILSSYGIAITVIRTNRPGYVVYEDNFQIAAYPFSDTPC